MSYVLQMLGRELITDFGEFFADDLPRLDDSNDIDQLDQEVHRHPQCPDHHIQLGLLYMQQRSFQLASEQFSAALRLSSDSRQTHLALVWALLRLGNDDQAVERLHKILRTFGPDPKICFALAFYHERAGDVNAAVSHYEKVLELDQSFYRSRFRLAAIFLRLNQFDKATEQYEILRSDNPGSVFVLVCLGSLYLCSDQPSLAVDMFQRALLIEPDNWQASDDLADALVKAGLYDDAIAHVGAEIAKQPACAGLHLRLAGLYAQTGHDQRALEHFQRSLQIHPNFLEAVVRLGAHHLRMNRFIDAAGCFARAVEINDNLLVAYVGLGVSQLRLGIPQEAHSSFDMAASIEPNTTLLFAEMAKLHLKHIIESRQSNFSSQTATTAQDARDHNDNFLLDQQLAAHAQLIPAHSNNADLHYRYGLLLEARNCPDQAIDQFRQALAINSAYLKAQIKLALALQRNEHIDQARELLNRTVQIDAESTELHYRLALVYSDHSKFALTIEQYQTTLEQTDQHLDMPANVSLALQNMRLIDPAAVSFNAMRQVTATLGAIPADS